MFVEFKVPLHIFEGKKSKHLLVLREKDYNLL